MSRLYYDPEMMKTLEKAFKNSGSLVVWHHVYYYYYFLNRERST